MAERGRKRKKVKIIPIGGLDRIGSNMTLIECDEQILALKRPRGMKLGLLIFALFTFCCIIALLVASPFATESYNDFVIAKAIFLGLFGIGLISVFGYLIYLLQWHQDR